MALASVLYVYVTMDDSDCFFSNRITFDRKSSLMVFQP